MPDYDAMAADYAKHPPTADEVVEVQVNPSALKTGRQKLARQAEVEGVAESELIRRAVDEYVTHHSR